MTDHLQPVRSNLQIKFTEIKATSDQRKQKKFAKKSSKKKVRREKQNQELSIQQDDTAEDTMTFIEHTADKDEPKNGRGNILDLEI